MNKLSIVIKNPYKIIYFLIRQSKIISSKISDKGYLKIAYRSVFGKKLDLENPETFNEKLQWLKLYDRKPIYTAMVDKYAAKRYVADIIGEEYIIPTLGVWNSFDDIDFSNLPNRFVLKCTHDSGGLVIVKDKKNLDKLTARKKIEECLKNDFYYMGREWPYKDVPHRIIAEKYMEDDSGELQDYKVFNYNGIPRQILVCRDRFLKSGLTEDFFDTEWKRLDIKRPKHDNSSTEIPMPINLKKMLELSAKLSKDIPFLRTDFYEVGNKLYFGELTLYPASGFEGFEPTKWDAKLGELIKLPENIGGGVPVNIR